MANTDSATPKRIQLIGNGRQDEAIAAGAITPGHLLARDEDAAVVVHASAGSYAEKIVAIEDALQGRTIADAYASGERVTFVHCEPGDVLYMLLAAGEDADENEFLTSNGNGQLKVATSTDQRLFAVVEAVSNDDTGDSGAARIKVRAL
jgi:hypothetical protein